MGKGNGGRTARTQITSAARLATIAVALALPTTASQGIGQEPVVRVKPAGERHPCATARVLCEGRLSVPLNWSDAGSDKITVAFVWVPREDTTRPATGTILANFGGPLATLPMTSFFQQLLGPVLDRQNLLVVEPRGLGKSEPLLCPGLTLGRAGAVASCADALGSRIQYFTTDQIAADMDAVRNALGLDEVTFYGNSYGTLFAVAYATRYPDRTAAIYLDGVVLVDESGYHRESMGISTADIDYVCARSPACDALPGRPALTLQRLITQLRATPDPEVPIAALPMLLQGANPVGMRELPAAASGYLAGDPAPLRRLTALFKGTEDPGFEDAELAGTLAIYCGDTRFPFERNASREERYRQLARFRSESRPLAPFEIEELPNYSNWADYCLGWPTLRASPPVPPNAIYPRVPVLAAAGDFDTWSLAEVADLIGRFPESTLLPVAYGGHSLATHPGPHGLCVRETMRRFLADPRHPTATPEGGDECHAENFRALGSFPVTLTGIPSAASEELSDPEARVVSAAFATAADAVARRNPNDAFGPIRPETDKGLRGGAVRWDGATGIITLEGVRFVEDLAVTGTVRFDEKGHAIAELTLVEGDGRSRAMILRWLAFVAENSTRVSGSIDGLEFTASVPLH